VNEVWTKFLIANHARIDADYELRFGDAQDEVREAATAAVIAPLLQRSVIRITGDDAEEFLLGQFTNDLRLLDEHHTQLSAYCTAQGRALAAFRVLRRDDDWLLILPTELRDSILKRLQMFVLRSRVVLEPLDDTVVLGMSGASTAAVVQDLVGTVPPESDSCTSSDAITAIRVGSRRTRFELIVPASKAPELWQQMTDQFRPVGTTAWEWLDIQDGIPSVVTETSEAFVPQMINLDALGAINFKKGCYPGQEIVARMHYLGRLKQRMYAAHVDADTVPHAGDKLYADSSADQAAGTVVNARVAPTGGSDLLAVIRIEAAEQEQVHLGAIDGPSLVLSELPYSVPEPQRS
jgi:folate-binding protein YgfZ